jgi:hypothetical protein
VCPTGRNSNVKDGTHINISSYVVNIKILGKKGYTMMKIITTFSKFTPEITIKPGRSGK